MKRTHLAIALAMAMGLLFVATGSSLVSIFPLFAQTNETTRTATYNNNNNTSTSGNMAAVAANNNNNKNT